MFPFLLTKFLSETFLSFWSGYLGAIATLGVVFIEKYYQDKKNLEKEIKILQLILQDIYLEFEEILETYEIILKEYEFSTEILFEERKVNLNYIKMLLIETDSRFTSIINVYILCIEKELRNIKILRNAKKNPKNSFRSFDVEKRLISIKKLVEKMKSYDEDPKTLKTLNGYCDYYEILLKDYQNGKL